MDAFRKQAERFGARIQQGSLVEISLKESPFRLQLSSGENLVARALIIATGASAKWMGIPGERRLMGKGVSACATCDGFFFRNLDIVVAGGGDTAMEEPYFSRDSRRRLQ